MKAPNERTNSRGALVQIAPHTADRPSDPLPERPGPDLKKIQALFDQDAAPAMWGSLDELAETDQFRKFLDDEYPDRTPDWLDPAKRRTFLKLMAASLGLAGLAACTKQPKELIVPYVRQPEEFVPGKPLFYATAMEMGGCAVGLLAESHLGRPTKIEGNPDHPGSLGAADYFHQASVLQLYDPDRSQVATYNGRISSWVNFQAAIANIRVTAATNGGTGIRILTEMVLSPTLGDQLRRLTASLPNAKWHQYQPAAKVGTHGGALAAFGKPVNTVYAFDRANVIMSLDADFLSCGSGNLRYAHDFVAQRRSRNNVTKPEQPKENLQEGYQPGPEAPYRNQAATHTEEDTSPKTGAPQVKAQGVPLDQTTQNRLYVVEPAPSPTGGLADHRYPMQAGIIPEFARQLAAAVGAGGGGQGAPPQHIPAETSLAFDHIPAIARDLKANAGACIVIAGEFQSPEVHALAHAMNASLGNTGKTVFHTDAIEANPVDPLQDLRALVADMRAGTVDTLIIIGGNPVYNAPVDLKFRDALSKVKMRVHLSTYNNETSEWCNWHLPGVHYLETWSDTRGFDGTVSIIQPLIAPLYDGISPHQLISVLAGEGDRSPYETVRTYWQVQAGGGASFDDNWQTWVHDGLVPNTVAAAANVTPAAAAAHPAATTTATAQTPAGTGANGGPIELIIRPDPTIWDGTWSNNGWLQEMPKPMTTNVWDNAIWLSPRLAQKFGITNEDLVEIKYRGNAVTGGAIVMPGHADDCVTAHLGYGRWRAGQLGNNIGYNAYLLQTSDSPAGGYGAEIRKVGPKHTFAFVQLTMTEQEREPVRVATLEEYKKHPEFVNEKDKPLPKWMTLYPDYAYEGYKWGMSIDLNSCVGCGACVVACQAENNIAVVGKFEVARGRHMHWIRVDRYFKGNWNNPETYFQPLPCMQCENAPCELVCPVAATVHSGEGINQMVYNRCVGTRYCSNNCPWKVRRFNFFLYSDWQTQSLYPLRNPDVTVRSRGVMEKCSYCIQRINAAKINAEEENRRVLDGEIVPACAQTCPTRAIVFGDINDPKSEVAQLKAQIRTYSTLEELNTRPRTTYMGRLTNPNPEIQKA